jgi:hypothetical protein
MSSSAESAIDHESAVSEINQVASDGVSKVNEAADSAVSKVKAAIPSQGATKDYGYAVIDPSTGKYVWPGDSNYDTYKAALGGDAGTVEPAKSSTIQAALAKIAAAKAASQAAMQSKAQTASSK